MKGPLSAEQEAQAQALAQTIAEAAHEELLRVARTLVASATAAADGAGMTAFQGTLSTQPARQLRLSAGQRMMRGLPPDAAHRPCRAAGLLAILAVLMLVAGTGGMALSFLYLGSPHPLDVMAGTAGFIAGAVFIAGGLVALAALSRPPFPAEAVVHALGCLWVCVPPLVAVLAWPALYFTLFLGGLLLMPFVLLACAVGAWPVSGIVTRHLWGLLGRAGSGPAAAALWGLRPALFACQLVAILASWPLFAELLDWLTALGYKVGWS